jgi:hypothetical protein
MAHRSGRLRDSHKAMTWRKQRLPNASNWLGDRRVADWIGISKNGIKIDTSSADCLSGLAGHDTLFGQGEDVLIGGAGDEVEGQSAPAACAPGTATNGRRALDDRRWLRASVTRRRQRRTFVNRCGLRPQVILQATS